MGNKLFTQVILLVTSVIIIVTYVRPAFTEIAVVQDDITRFDNTVSRAAELNTALRDLIATEQSISNSEIVKLSTYLPTELDEVTIMRDINNIFTISEVDITSMNAAAGEAIQISSNISQGSRRAASVEGGDPSVVYRDFAVQFMGTYEQLKSVLENVESNAYPLEIVDLVFASAQEEDGEQTSGLPRGYMQYSLTLRAFALPGS